MVSESFVAMEKSDRDRSREHKFGPPLAWKCDLWRIDPLIKNLILWYVPQPHIILDKEGGTSKFRLAHVSLDGLIN